MILSPNDIDFGSLENMSQTSIHQPVLVGQYAIIQMPALNFTFPALESCDYLTTWGNISKLSMPMLIGGKDVHDPISIDAQTIFESPVPINFDSLTNAAEIDVKVSDHTSTVFAAQYDYISPEYESRVFRCQSYFVGETKKGLSPDVQNGLGFGLGPGGGLAAVLEFAWLLRWVRQRKAGKSGGKGGENGEGQSRANTRSEIEGDGREINITRR
ncbi:uncharacterized protein Bfra_009903 [Botrytis fragariae]|uniref:Uncharacterized protein n=1 Tax=Botrytis fragariae TaxID=1964551 RepID=A0A8H6ANH3_9HELO|nr:uncharacterized protein Bfra_009903 [Botrytis fragariae]KAF5870515.1 hypothetical protein Bfra_009903 [Botrytis fragariae]